MDKSTSFLMLRAWPGQHDTHALLAEPGEIRRVTLQYAKADTTPETP